MTPSESPLSSTLPDTEVEEVTFDSNPQCSCCGQYAHVLQVVLASAGCGAFLGGFNVGALNSSIGAIESDFNWCGYEGVRDCTAATNYTAFLRTIVLFGGAIGSVIGGSIMYLGRRFGILLSMAVFALGTITSCLANAFPSLLWGRLLVGCGCGLVGVLCPMYIAEMSPRASRGTYGVCFQAGCTLGIFVAVLLGMPFSSPPETEDRYMWTLPVFDKIWWRVMLGLGIIPAAIGVFLFGRTYSHETPHYYVENGRSKDAEALLKVLHGKDNVLEELNDIEEGVETARAAKENGLSCTSAFRHLEYRWVLIVGCTLAAFQQLSGISCSLTFSNSLFEDAGLGGSIAHVMSTVQAFTLMLMTVPTFFLVESMGRRPLMLMGICGQIAGVLPGAVLLVIFGEDDPIAQWISIAGMLVFMAFYGVSLGPVTSVYLSEIFPAEIKGAAVGTATMLSWVSGIVLAFVVQYLSIAAAFPLFTVLNCCLLAMVYFAVVETKGRSIDDSPFFTKKPLQAKQLDV